MNIEQPIYFTSRKTTKLLGVHANTLRRWEKEGKIDAIRNPREYNSKVIITTEEYSSISCTNCGIINKINKNRELNCKNCNLSIDRDVNGARNIYLSTLYG